MTLDYLSAFVIGLLGSGHCIVMCGGISTLLTSAIKVNQQHKDLTNNTLTNNTLTNNTLTNNRYIIVLAYHIGRILSYSVIGAVVAFTSSIAVKNIGISIVFLKTITGFFLILLGLYIAKWLMWLNYIELLGKHIWRYLSPKTKRFIPIQNSQSAFFLGCLWGWLPCGLVYSTLTWALASANIIDGFFIMLFFGLGTLPALLSLSLGVFNIKALLSQKLFRNVTAILIILYGIYTIVIAYQ